MMALDTLAAHYVQEANKEKKSEKRRELFTKATVLVTTADKIIMHNPRHVLGRAFFCLYEGDKIEQANFALESATKLLDHYTSFFNVPYPLPKQGVKYTSSVHTKNVHTT